MIANMELCTARGSSSVPSITPKLIASNQIQSVRCKTQFPFVLKQIRLNSVGLRSRMNSSLRADTSEETSAGRVLNDADEPKPNSEITVNTTDLAEKTSSEETSAGRVLNDADEPKPNGEITVNTTDLAEKNEDYDANETQGALVDNLQFLKFLEDYDIKFDYEDASSYLVFGGGGAVALWLAAAVVGAIDSIPLVPKVFELVGLGYTIWFSSRYLIFKENRDELFATIEQIKQQVLGSKDN